MGKGDQANALGMVRSKIGVVADPTQTPEQRGRDAGFILWAGGDIPQLQAVFTVIFGEMAELRQEIEVLRAELKRVEEIVTARQIPVDARSKVTLVDLKVEDCPLE